MAMTPFRLNFKSLPSACSHIPECRTSHCIQSSIDHRFNVVPKRVPRFGGTCNQQSHESRLLALIILVPRFLAFPIILKPISATQSGRDMRILKQAHKREIRTHSNVGSGSPR